MNINDFYTVRLRINNYLCIISICLCNFSDDNTTLLDHSDLPYVQKIEEGRLQMLSLLMDIEGKLLNKSAEPDLMNTYRHDMRLAINIIQGYSEVVLENLQEKSITTAGGHFAIIIQAAREILKNIELLHDSPSS